MSNTKWNYLSFAINSSTDLFYCPSISSDDDDLSFDVSLTLFKSYLDNEVMIMCGSVY